MEKAEHGGVELLYIADPMCSWCYGFAPVLAALEPRLRDGVAVRLVLGGLAQDDDAPMDAETRAYVQGAWRTVEARAGVPFEHAFWERCTPRRSTWQACRAVLAAGERGREMFAAIQRAFYREARDPSDRATLVELAGEMGLDRARFDAALDSREVHAALARDFALRDALGVRGYPSLATLDEGRARVLTAGWVDAEALERVLDSAGLLAVA